MNCESIRNEILLDQAGELTAERSAGLGKHLAECTACREFADDAEKIVAIAGQVLPSGQPSHAAIRKIIASAERHGGRDAVVFMRSAGPRWLALAAGLLLLVAGGYVSLSFYLQDHTAAHGVRAAQVSSIMSMVSEDESAIMDNGEAKTDLRILAAQILRVEELSIDDPVEEDEEAIQADDPLTRDLQSHSTGDARPATCV